MSLLSRFFDGGEARREAEWSASVSRSRRDAEEGRRNEAQAFERMQEAFAPLSDDQREKIILEVSMRDGPRGNSSGTWTAQASIYNECAVIARRFTACQRAMNGEES